MSPSLFYTGKTILITGAASGIGKLFAETVAARYDLSSLILWDRNEDQLLEIKKQLKGTVPVETAGIDVMNFAAIQAVADTYRERGLLPDIIINSAGIVVGKMFHEHTPQEIERTLMINAAGSMWVTHAFLSDFVKRGNGVIVNIGSASAYIGNPRMSVYASSKWAVHGWSESLRLEMASLGSKIQICTVIPSYIDTGMFEGVKAPLFVPILKPEEIVEKMIVGIAKGRREIKAPFMVHLVPLLKALLPAALFDWLAGSVLGVYRSMDNFKGKG